MRFLRDKIDYSNANFVDIILRSFIKTKFGEMLKNIYIGIVIGIYYIIHIIGTHIYSM